MENQKVIEIKWSEKATENLKISAGDDLEIIKEQVKSKTAQLWFCQNQTQQAYVVTRIEKEITGSEMVIVCFEGSGLKSFLSEFIQKAIELNMTIRAHVKRKGLLKIGSELGFNSTEYVLRFNNG
jgi:hypothetical protein